MKLEEIRTLLPLLVDLWAATTHLRISQKNYMADRGNNAKGELVASAAASVDVILEALEAVNV